MKYKVIKKQQNSRRCLVCGMKNSLGLKSSFYELENGELIAVFDSLDEHQSYPNRVHGGIITAILDETIGRAIMINSKDAIWGVTIEINVKFKKPVSTDETIKVVGRITKDSSRIFEGTGELLLPSGEVAATAHGKYLKVPLNKISDFDEEKEEWKVINNNNDPQFFEI